MNPKLKPFLTLPFKKQQYHITEGWRYSDQEKSIHGMNIHGGIDFELPRFAPVLAAADGWATSSYFWYELKNNDGTPRLYKDKPIANTFGLFVQIYHPEVDYYTAYAHLEDIAPEIKFHKPVKRGERFWPIGHKINPQKLPKYPGATKVKRGQTIGYVGDRGLTWGYSDYPKRPDPNKFPSWDEVHLHFEVFIRKGTRKLKKYFDPYDIKGKAGDYPDSFKSREMETEGPVLWMLDENGFLQFAD